MPFPVAAAIAAGSALAAGGLSAYSAGRMNKKSMAFSREMYERQRQDAISDWERVNAYNHPSAQRARIEEAGLNAALMYGNSASGGNAGVVRDSNVGNPQFQAPDFGFIADAGTSYLNTMVDLDIKQAQLDNLKQQNTNHKTENLLKLSQIDRNKFDLGFDMSLAEISAETKRQVLRSHEIDNYVKLRADDRAQITTDMNVREATERIILNRLNQAKTKQETQNLRAALQILKTDAQIKQLDYEFYKDGIRPTDSIIARVLHRLFNTAMDNGGTTLLENAKGAYNMYQFYNR